MTGSINNRFAYLEDLSFINLKIFILPSWLSESCFPHTQTSSVPDTFLQEHTHSFATTTAVGRLDSLYVYKCYHMLRKE